MIFVSSCLKINISLSFLNSNVVEGASTPLNKKLCGCRKRLNYLKMYTDLITHIQKECSSWNKKLQWEKKGSDFWGLLMEKWCQHVQQEIQAFTIIWFKYQGQMNGYTTESECMFIVPSRVKRPGARLEKLITANAICSSTQKTNWFF